MLSDTIECDILIEAPVEVVWKVVTEPEQITKWFSDEADLDLRPGGDGSLTFGAKATNQPVTVPLCVVAVEPPHRFAYRWDHPAGVEPREGNSLLVEFTLTDEGGNTRLRVVESGFAALERSEEEKVTYAEAHAKGWDVHTASLRDYVAGQS
jgi:uncharacterized protein YndB with AHSA1/START domain